MFIDFYKDSQETILSGLRNINSQALKLVIGKIHPQTVLLNVGWNDFGNRSTQELEYFFKCIHQNVTSIDLRGNNLDKKNSEEVALVFAAFSHATHVALSSNNLNSLKNLDKAFKGFVKTNVNSLDLNFNDLGYLDNGMFQNSLKELTGIQSLNLSYNKLANKSGEELEQLCAAFSEKLHHLNMSNNNLGNKVKHLGKLPKNITSLDISDNAIHELSIQDLDEMEGLFVHLTTFYLSYDEVKQMTSASKNKLELMCSTIDKVIFLDTAGKNIADQQSPFASPTLHDEPRFSFWSRLKPTTNEKHSLISSIPAVKK